MYKRSSQREVRAEILDTIRDRGELTLTEELRALALGMPDVLDAMLCLLSGRDFLEARCIPPPPGEIVRREGWAWVPDPNQP
jgi:hypothetical protein